MVKKYRSDSVLEHIEMLVRSELERGTKDLERRVTTRIALDLGGQNVYFPFDRARRNEKIYNDFTGNNVSELAQLYRVSVQTIYAIIKAERARRCEG